MLRDRDIVTASALLIDGHARPRTLLLATTLQDCGVVAVLQGVRTPGAATRGRA